MDPSELGTLLGAATQDVFSTMLQLQLDAKAAFENHTPLVSSELTAMIGLAGDLRGSLSLHCTREQAQAFTAKLIGAAPHEITDEGSILDAMGELANMMAGNVKRTYPDPSSFDLSIPTVAMPAHGLRVTASRSVVVPFSSALGEFCAELILERKRARPQPIAPAT